MKSILLAVIVLSSGMAHALDTTTSTLKLPAYTEPKMNSTEFGLVGTSLNSGSLLSSIAFVHEYDSGYALGLRGFLPLLTSGDSQVYLGQILGRSYLTNDENITFVELAMGMVYHDGNNNTRAAPSIGFEYGYKRQFTNQLSVGAAMGVELAGARFRADEYASDGWYLYNKLGLSASYYY